MMEIMGQRKFFLQSPHWAPLPEEGGFPVLRERLHCLQSGVLQFLQGKESEDPQPAEYLHISNYDKNRSRSPIYKPHLNITQKAKGNAVKNKKLSSF